MKDLREELQRDIDQLHADPLILELAKQEAARRLREPNAEDQTEKIVSVKETGRKKRAAFVRYGSIAAALVLVGGSVWSLLGNRMKAETSSTVPGNDPRILETADEAIFTEESMAGAAMEPAAENVAEAAAAFETVDFGLVYNETADDDFPKKMRTAGAAQKNDGGAEPILPGVRLMPEGNMLYCGSSSRDGTEYAFVYETADEKVPHTVVLWVDMSDPSAPKQLCRIDQAGVEAKASFDGETLRIETKTGRETPFFRINGEETEEKTVPSSDRLSVFYTRDVSGAVNAEEENIG